MIRLLLIALLKTYVTVVYVALVAIGMKRAYEIGQSMYYLRKLAR